MIEMENQLVIPGFGDGAKESRREAYVVINLSTSDPRGEGPLPELWLLVGR